MHRYSTLTLRAARLPLSSGLLVAGLVALTACNTQPAATNAVADSPKPLVARITGVPLATQPAPVEQSAGSASGNVPLLHKPFSHIKQVAPGLQVQVSSVPVADTEVVREPSDLRLAFSIKYNGRVIYRDTANDGLTYTHYALPQTEKLYPLWIPTGPDSGELLVAFNNRPSKELARRFFIKNAQVAKIDTLLTFSGPGTDVDQDGKLEYAGFYDFSEGWQDEQGCARRMYVPTLYYEARPSGLVLDSALTKRKAIAQYGAFYGYQDSDKPVIYAK